eukprot:3104349-Ditylum_brightwellii.AAC.1
MESPPVEYGRGMRTRKKPILGNWYMLSDVVPSDTMPYKMGVINLNMDIPVQVQTPDEGWVDDNSLTEHLLGVTLVQQYNLKKGLELFGDRAEKATTKELQQIHNFGTCVPQEAKSLSSAERMKALLAL